jgi:hypothetical protein
MGFINYAKRTVKGLRHDSVRVIKTALRGWGCTNCKVGRNRGLAFPPLGELRTAFEKKYGPQEWENADAEDWEVLSQDDEEFMPMPFSPVTTPKRSTTSAS